MTRKMPGWAKILGIISICVFVVLTIYSTIVVLGISSGGYNIFEMMFFPVLVLPIFFVIILMWALGFLTQYLIEKHKFLVANVISLVGLLAILIFGVYFFITFFNSLESSLGIETLFWPIMYLFWIVILIIYFIVSLVLISKSKK